MEYYKDAAVPCETAIPANGMLKTMLKVGISYNGRS